MVMLGRSGVCVNECLILLFSVHLFVNMHVLY